MYEIEYRTQLPLEIQELRENLIRKAKEALLVLAVSVTGIIAIDFLWGCK